MKYIFSLFITLVLFVNTNVVAQKQTQKNTSEYFGNWYEPIKNEWTFGFYQRFVVYKGKCWEYKSQNTKKNKGTLNLQNGGETLQLAFNKTNDSTLQISLENQKMITYKKAGRYLPHYTTADTTRFTNNHFAQVDTAYISGYLPNWKSAKPFEILLLDIITDNETTYFGEVDSSGCFQMKVPLYNSTMVFLDWGKMHKYDVLEPNEHYFLYYDHVNKQTLFMGENARIHNELSTFDFSGIPRKAIKQDTSYLDFFATKREEYKKANDYTNRILSQMPNPSERLRYFSYNFNKYNYANKLMLYNSYKLDSHTPYKLPDELIAFARDTLLANPPIPLTISKEFFYFMRPFVSTASKIKKYHFVDPRSTFLNMVMSDKLILDRCDRDIVRFINEPTRFIGSDKKDTIDLKWLASKIPPKDWQKRFDGLYKQYEELINEENLRLSYELLLSDQFDGVNRVLPHKIMRDYNLASLLYKNLNQERKPIEKVFFEKMINQVKTPIFRDKVIAAQKFYTEMSGKSFEHTESLKNTDHLKEVKDADALWKELITPYKGKILYFDFWGTWCGACKIDMQYVADVKKQLAGKDIVFMYFAYISPEESWKRVILNYSLTGDNVVHYRLPEEQQGLIIRHFGIYAYPSYMLIDRNGNIMDTKPPRPSDNGMLVEYLKGWLEKK